MNRILKFIERSMDDDSFNEEDFNARYFDVSENRFARLLKMLTDAGYITGVEIRDNGEPEEFEKKNYRRFQIFIYEDVSITIKGMEFLTRNSALANIYKTAKSVADLIP